MILITGTSGLLGASLVTRAHDLGHEVAGLYYQHPLQIPGVKTFSADLKDGQSIRDLIADLRPKTIIHCAAATNVDWCEEHPQETERINVQVSVSLAEMARKAGARLVFISTDSVFDGKRGNYAETDEPAPLNTYACSKLRAEREILQQDTDALVVRVNIYGWNAQDKQSLAEWILSEMTAGKRVPGFTDVHFSPILANDLADVLLDMSGHELSGLYHVAGSERISKYEFARQVAETFGFDPGRIVPTPMAVAHLRAPRPSDVSLNTELISKTLGYAMPDVKSGLQKFKELNEQEFPQRLKSYLIGANAWN